MVSKTVDVQTFCDIFDIFAHNLHHLGLSFSFSLKAIAFFQRLQKKNNICTYSLS